MICPICLEKVVYKEIETSCSHCFHKNCLDKWFAECTINKCPVCRREIEYTIIGRLTRSKTSNTRAKRVILSILCLIDLFNIALHKEEKKRIAKKILKKVHVHRIILKKYKHFWFTLRGFAKQIIDTEDGKYYKELLYRWNIKFRSHKASS